MYLNSGVFWDKVSSMVTLFQADSKCFWLLFDSTRSVELNSSFHLHRMLYSVEASSQRTHRVRSWTDAGRNGPPGGLAVTIKVYKYSPSLMLLLTRLPVAASGATIRHRCKTLRACRFPGL